MKLDQIVRETWENLLKTKITFEYQGGETHIKADGKTIVIFGN